MTVYCRKRRLKLVFQGPLVLVAAGLFLVAYPVGSRPSIDQCWLLRSVEIFFFSCEMNSINLSSPNSTNILG